MPPLTSIRLQRSFTPLLIGFLIVGALIFGVALLYTDATTTITITPLQKQITTSFSIPVQTGSAVDEQALSATIANEPLKATVSVPASAEGELVDAHATGTMTVLNTTSTAQTLAATTRFRSTDGIIVRSTKRVDVPGKGQVEVPVIADPIGVSGNVAAGKFTIVALWPGLQASIYGQTSAAMTGGQVRQGSTLSADDLNAASTKAREEIATTFGTSSSGTIKFVTPKSVTTNPAANKPSDSYAVTVTMTGTTVTYNPKDLESFVRTKLAKEVPTGFLLQSFEQPTITQTSDLDLTLRIEVKGWAAPDTTADIFNAGLFAGKSRSTITQLLLETERVKAVVVSFAPGWQTTAPNDPQHIRITFTDPSAP